MDFIFDPSLVLYLPLYELDGASFRSRDAYGHLATVTGALWTPRGRSFDGVDDKITLPDVAALRPTDFTLLFRAKGMNVVNKALVANFSREGGPEQGWFVFTHQDGGNWYLRCQVNAGNGIVASFAGWQNLNDGGRHQLGVRVSGTTISYIIDGIVQPTTATVTVPVYYATSYPAIGSVYYSGAYSYFFNNLIGEVMLYNRILTPLEIQRNYLATKWR